MRVGDEDVANPLTLVQGGHQGCAMGFDIWAGVDQGHSACTDQIAVCTMIRHGRGVGRQHASHAGG